MATAKKAAPAPAPAKQATKQPSTAVTKRASTAVEVAEVDPALLEQDAAKEQGQFGKDDLAIPFLRVLQDLSPQVKKKDEAYVEGAEPGMFFNTVTKQLWPGDADEDGGVVIIPVHYTPSYIAWRLREKGGGLVHDYGADASIMAKTTPDDKGRNILKGQPDVQVVKSGLYYVFIVDPETGRLEQAAFTLSGTQLKKSRQWNTRMQSIALPRANGQGTFCPPIFAYAYKVTTQYESNDKGSWYGVTIEQFEDTLKLPFGGNIYLAARQFKELIGAGQVKVQQVEDVEFEVEEGDGEGEDKDKY